jgi:hypothetical protein
MQKQYKWSGYEKKNQKLLNILLHYSANIPKVYSTFIEHSHSQKKKKMGL